MNNNLNSNLFHCSESLAFEKIKHFNYSVLPANILVQHCVYRGGAGLGAIRRNANKYRKLFDS